MDAQRDATQPMSSPIQDGRPPTPACTGGRDAACHSAPPYVSRFEQRRANNPMLQRNIKTSAVGGGALGAVAGAVAVGLVLAAAPEAAAPSAFWAIATSAEPATAIVFAGALPGFMYGGTVGGVAGYFATDPINVLDDVGAYLEHTR